MWIVHFFLGKIQNESGKKFKFSNSIMNKMLINVKKESKNYHSTFFSFFENLKLHQIVYLHWIWTVINVSWQLIEIFRLIQIFPKNWKDPKYAKYGVFDSCHQQVARRIQYSGFRCNTVASNRRRRITSNFIIFTAFESKRFFECNFEFFIEFRKKFCHRIFSRTIYSTPRNRNCYTETFGSAINSLSQRWQSS